MRNEEIAYYLNVLDLGTYKDQSSDVISVYTPKKFAEFFDRTVKEGIVIEFFLEIIEKRAFLESTSRDSSKDTEFEWVELEPMYLEIDGEETDPVLEINRKKLLKYSSKNSRRSHLPVLDRRCLTTSFDDNLRIENEFFYTVLRILETFPVPRFKKGTRALNEHIRNLVSDHINSLQIFKLNPNLIHSTFFEAINLCSMDAKDARRLFSQEDTIGKTRNAKLFRTLIVLSLIDHKLVTKPTYNCLRDTLSIYIPSISTMDQKDFEKEWSKKLKILGLEKVKNKNPKRPKTL